MLKLLRRIVQEVNAALDLPSALVIMVERVREAIHTQAATIYLIDNHRSQFVLMATDGLNPDAIGKVRIPMNQGLIGLVARREEPINLEDVHSHECYYYHPEVGEEKFRAFLAVPIIHHRRMFGVLALQQEEQRRYEEEEEAFVVTVAMQLGAIIAEAEAAGKLGPLMKIPNFQASQYDEAAIGGIPSVLGVAIGQAVVVYPLADLDAVPDKPAESIDEEIAKFSEALDAARVEVEQIKQRMQTSLPDEELALFDVYLKLLSKDSLGKAVIEEIQQGLWAQAALRRVIKQSISQFEAMEDEYLRERASDFRDLGRRLLSHLQASQPHDVKYTDETILVGEEITASELAAVPEGQLAGLVSSQGSSNSHVAILARAMGVPTVMGAKGMAVSELAGKQLIVDGYFGQVYVSPSDTLLKEFRILADEERELDESLEQLRNIFAETPDNHRMRLQVNMGLAGDAGLPLSVGAEGVGLFRTEVPFMTRDRFPSEEEQRVIYQQMLKAFMPRPVTMRTLDIGGDKVLSYFPVKEDNPFLGWRGIRITLDHPELFLIQVRAMLRASDDSNNLRILLPMISGVGELDEAIHLIKQAFGEVVEEGHDITMPPIGVMIEVPSAVYQARDLAKRVDFLSVGSNDLTQYILAVDRNNPRVAGLYDSLHPAVLRALLQVVEGGHTEGKEVSICGEMASDPVAVILLLAMGFDMLSMNASSLPRMKWVIRNFTLAYARKLLSEVLEMDNPTLIRFHLEKALEQVGLGGLIRAGKN